MKKIAILVMSLFVINCASPKGIKSSGTGDNRTRPVEFIDHNTFMIVEKSSDNTYGYTEANPVKVGEVHNQSGPLNERRFLNALLGPNGQPVQYFRLGSFCHFKTPNGLVDNTGFLDIYKVFWSGSKDTLSIYINMYDEGDPYIPTGLTAKTK